MMRLCIAIAFAAPLSIAGRRYKEFARSREIEAKFVRGNGLGQRHVDARQKHICGQ
jgi:hypothetical protein